MPRAIALDLGTKRIGVALSSGFLATPYETIHRVGSRKKEHAQVAALVEEAGAEIVVVGLPLSLDGSMGPAAVLCTEEAQQLAATLSVPVETYDERFTTVTAERWLKEQQLNAKARRKVVDKVAATILLQAWLDSQEAQSAESS